MRDEDLRSYLRNERALQAYILTIDPVGGDRRKGASMNWETTNIAHQFITGYTPAEVEPSDYSVLSNRFQYKRPLTMGEVACYKGHRKIWRKILNDGTYVGLVLEDDARIVDYEMLMDFLADVVLRLDYRSWDIIKLFNVTAKRPLAVRSAGQSKIVYHPRPPNGSVGYLITPGAARKLLRRKRVFRPVDEDFSHPWELGLRVWSAADNLIDEMSEELGGSLLEYERDRMELRSRRKRARFAVKRNALELKKQVRSTLYARKVITEVESLSTGWG